MAAPPNAQRDADTCFISNTDDVIAVHSACTSFEYQLQGLFLLIHFRHIPVSWGDVSQALIYHQVRKYLLRLENVQLKYWRPQILLLTVNPRTSFEALRFANDMKKGGLYIVGRVLVGEMNRTTAKRQADLQKAWNEMGKYVKIKTFADIVISDTVRKGVQSLLATSGLGGMRPVPNQQLLSRACAFCRPLLRLLPSSRERRIGRRHIDGLRAVTRAKM